MKFDLDFLHFLVFLADSFSIRVVLLPVWVSDVSLLTDGVIESVVSLTGCDSSLLVGCVKSLLVDCSKVSGTVLSMYTCNWIVQ